MFLRINTIIFSLLAMMAFDGATALAQENDPLFDAAWRSFDTGDFPTYIPEFFDVDADGDDRNPALMGVTVEGTVPRTKRSANNGFDSQIGRPKSSNIPHDRKGWWARVQRGLTEAEYNASMTGQGLQAPNRAHNLRSYFEPGGVRIHDRTAAGRSELAALSLVGIGRGDALATVAVGTVTQAGARVEIRRPGVVEWYENSAHGLEQGFTISTKSEGTGPLKLELAVDSARAALHRDSVVLTSNTGRRLRYGGLVVVDACGQTIASHFEVPSPNRVRLIIDDTNAVYPLVIDPLITAIPDAILESNQAWSGSFDAALMGASVSGAGDVNGDGFADVIVGAPGWDNGLMNDALFDRIVYQIRDRDVRYVSPYLMADPLSD